MKQSLILMLLAGAIIAHVNTALALEPSQQSESGAPIAPSQAEHSSEGGDQRDRISGRYQKFFSLRDEALPDLFDPSFVQHVPAAQILAIRTQYQKAVGAFIRAEKARVSAEGGQVVCLIAADHSISHGEVVHLIDLVKQEGVARFAINIDPVPEPADGAAPAAP